MVRKELIALAKKNDHLPPYADYRVLKRTHRMWRLDGKLIAMPIEWVPPQDGVLEAA